MSFSLLTAQSHVFATQVRAFEKDQSEGHVTCVGANVHEAGTVLVQSKDIYLSGLLFKQLLHNLFLRLEFCLSFQILECSTEFFSLCTVAEITQSAPRG